MNDSTGETAFKAILTFLVLVIPVSGVIPLILKRHKVLGSAFNGARSLASNAAKATGKLGKKGALTTKQGQAAQQFLANKKAVNSLKGKEYLRQAAEKNPMIASLMGGVGGKDISNRLFDQQNRAKRAEDITNINRSLSTGVASAIGGKENLGDVLNRIEANPNMQHKWNNGREIVAEDIASLKKLRQQGFIDPTGHAKNDSMLATAAMQELFNSEVVSEKNIAGVSSLLRGASAEENADYTDELRKVAAAKGYKNFTGATVDHGRVSEFFAKTGQSEFDLGGNYQDNIRLGGAIKAVESGLSGIHRDALDPTHDRTPEEIRNMPATEPIMLRAIGEKYKQLQTDDQRKAFVLKTAGELSHINKDKVLNAVAEKLQVDPATFANLQRSLKSGGAIPLPQGYNNTPPQPSGGGGGS